MPSQADWLREQIARSEARSGPDNPFVQGLKAQLAMLTKPRAENPCVMRVDPRTKTL